LAGISTLPRAAERAFQHQRYGAKKRGIPFLFTRDEWWAWWQVDGRWERRGRFGHNLCMARKGDVGPYSAENVYPATMADNSGSVASETKAAAGRLGAAAAIASGNLGAAFAMRGDGHPRSKAVVTPLGRFGSAALAGEAHGIGRSAASYRATHGVAGWRYE
jgi:hypothetical protein